MSNFQRVMAEVRRETAMADLAHAHKTGATQAIAAARREVQRATHEVMRMERLAKSRAR